MGQVVDKYTFIALKKYTDEEQDAVLNVNVVHILNIYRQMGKQRIAEELGEWP